MTRPKKANSYTYLSVGGRNGCLLWDERRPRGREAEVEAILGFVSSHPHSYASLAVCRRALDSGIDRVDGAVISDLNGYLQSAPDEEIKAFYSIIG